MNNLTKEELKNLKNQFEIEERVVKKLKYQDDIDYYNHKLRRTTSDQFTEEERLKSTTQREEHWNKLASELARKFFGIEVVINNNKQNMSEQQKRDSSSSRVSNNSDMLQIAEILKEIIQNLNAMINLTFWKNQRSMMVRGTLM
jgi:hypothetical protein